LFKRILVLIVVLCWPLPVFAAHPLITDDAGTQGKGKFLFEFNGEYGRTNKDDVIENGGQVAAALTYGINDQIDIYVNVPYSYIRMKETDETEDGFFDTSVSLKWRFYEKEGLSLALKPGVTLPTGNDEKGRGSGRITGNMYFIATKEFAPYAIHLNLGYIRNENNVDEREDLWHASLAGEMKIIKDLKLVANIGIDRSPDKCSGSDPAFILGGIIYTIRENLDIDFGLKSWFNKSDNGYSVLAGLSLRF
jgi:hypothetical protein